jgi:hypothetical protein
MKVRTSKTNLTSDAQAMLQVATRAIEMKSQNRTEAETGFAGSLASGAAMMPVSDNFKF